MQSRNFKHFLFTQLVIQNGLMIINDVVNLSVEKWEAIVCLFGNQRPSLGGYWAETIIQPERILPPFACLETSTSFLPIDPSSFSLLFSHNYQRKSLEKIGRGNSILDFSPRLFGWLGGCHWRKRHREPDERWTGDCRNIARNCCKNSVTSRKFFSFPLSGTNQTQGMWMIQK